MSTTIRLVRGDLARRAAAAVVTSANDALVGNAQPLYWRFTNQKNVDGAVRAAAGPGLANACLDLPTIEPGSFAGEEPRDISRWAESCKRGSSVAMRCRPGEAVVTDAFGLDADFVVHAVAPDSEFGYEGHYQGMPGVRGEEVRATSAPPLVRLRAAYESTFAACRDRSAATIALPALGAGVKGWRPAVSAALALDAVARDARRDAFDDVSFVLGSDAAFVAFGKVFELLAGPADDDGAWYFAPGDARLSGLDLGRVPELAPRESRPNRGYAGDFWRPSEAGWR